MKPIVYAVVVTYFPISDKFLSLISKLILQTSKIIVVDNTDANDDRVFEILSIAKYHFDNIDIVRLGKNFGIATALNIGIDIALKAGCTHVLLSDQDSLPDNEMVVGLLKAEAEASADGAKIGAVGPVYIDKTTGMRFPFQVKSPKHLFYSKKQIDNKEPNIRTLSLITSGSLIKSEVLRSVGSMREDFFIDYVDVEWCHRAMAKGYTLIGTLHAFMYHGLGDWCINVWFFGWRKINGYSPKRLYFRFRNFTYMLRLSYIPILWKIYSSKDLLDSFYTHIFFAPSPLENLKAILLGLKHGLYGKMSPIE